MESTRYHGGQHDRLTSREHKFLIQNPIEVIFPPLYISQRRIVSVITEISSAHGYKNSASSNSDEVIHGPELIPQHSKKVKNYTK
jgi:hypothetical protein